MGSAREREVTQGEMMNREIHSKSLHAWADLDGGKVIIDEDIIGHSPDYGQQPNCLSARPPPRHPRTTALVIIAD